MTGIREVFNSHETTTLTFDCYGTLGNWEDGVCKALRQTYGFSQPKVTDEALIDLFLKLPHWVLRCFHRRSAEIC